LQIDLNSENIILSFLSADRRILTYRIKKVKAVK